MSRTFTGGPAVRVRTPLWIDVVGPSGSGKTLSSILLAEGIQRVQPGPIVVIDTESLRALKHANGNPDRFIHVPFAEPFGPLDYIDAFKHAITYNPSTIIVDSMSHEWEGPGGVLAQHAAVVAARGDSYKMTAWIKPKADHTAMKHFILQQRCNWILCFRAKEKVKPKKGGEPEDLGWQPLGSEDLIYEADLGALLYPGADGRPRWQSKLQHEQEHMKVPGWFRGLFAGDPQLTPDIGEHLARWAIGGAADAAVKPSQPSPHLALIDLFDACSTVDILESTKAEMKARWESIPKGDARSAVTKAFKAAEERIEAERQRANNE